MLKTLDELLKKVDATKDRVRDKVFYPDEDVLQRNARRKREEEEYGTGLKRFAKLWLPGEHFYSNFKETQKNNKPLKAKLSEHTQHLGQEIILDVVRIGAIYGIYKFNVFLYHAYQHFDKYLNKF